MPIDVIMVPQQAGNQLIKGQTTIILDILRATSTMVTALANQARQIIPVMEPEAAFQIRQTIGAENCILGGERKGYKLNGFDLGNSPAEYLEANVSGKNVILCTSNGTKAVLWTREAREVIIGSFLNMKVICDYLKSSYITSDIFIVCSGREGNFSLEDFTGAGMIVSAIGSNYELTDRAKTAQFTFEKAWEIGLASIVSQTEHGRYLKEIGMESDIAWCTTLNKFPILPRLVDGVIKLT